MKKEDKYPLFCLTIFLIIFTIAAINPWFPQDWLLESLLTLVTVPILILTYKQFRFSNLSYTLILIFLIAHTIGSHYTYSSTPFMAPIAEFFNFTRNHYDRLVHFLFGFLGYLPILEIYKRFSGIKLKLFNYFIPVLMIIALGAIYEIAEWIVTITVNPNLGTAYLGFQGDQWDTQKDMLMKVIGSILGMCLILIKRK